VELQRGVTQGALRAFVIDADFLRIGGDGGSCLRGRHVHGKQGRRFRGPHLGLLPGLAQLPALRLAEVVIEQAAVREPRRRIQRGRHERGIHVVGVTAASQSLFTVAPIAGHAPGLDADQIAEMRLRGESRGSFHQPGKVARQRAAVGTHELACARLAALVVQQPARRERRQQEVVVDHAVVVDGRGDAPAALARVAQHREFADVLFVRYLAVRRQAIEHRGNGALHGPGFQHRRQQQRGDQRVAAKVGIEAPRAGEVFLAITQEREDIARAPILAGGRREHGAERRERRLSTQRLYLETQRRARRGSETSGGQLSVCQDVDREAITRGAIEPVALPGNTFARDPGRYQDFLWSGRLQFEVAQHAYRREHCATRTQLRGAGFDFEFDALQDAALSIERRDRTRRPGERPLDGCGRLLEPQAHAAVAGGKCHEDARVVPGAQQQVRGHRAVTQETVDVVPFVDAKGERVCRRRIGGRRGRHAHRKGQQPGEQHTLIHSPASLL
jgi:hypothetical protein